MFLDKIKLTSPIAFKDKKLQLWPRLQLIEKREARERLPAKPKPAGS